jgi:hypothetical protein
LNDVIKVLFGGVVFLLMGNYHNEKSMKSGEFVIIENSNNFCGEFGKI